MRNNAVDSRPARRKASSPRDRTSRGHRVPKPSRLMPLDGSARARSPRGGARAVCALSDRASERAEEGRTHARFVRTCVRENLPASSRTRYCTRALPPLGGAVHSIPPTPRTHNFRAAQRALITRALKLYYATDNVDTLLPTLRYASSYR